MRSRKLIVAFAIGAVAAAALDQRWQNHQQSNSMQSSNLLASASGAFNILGQPGAIVISSALYGSGRLLNRPGLADAGLHATEAIAISGAVTALLKRLAGRGRPTLMDDGEIDADNFRIGGGRKAGYTSFPSGHATAAFAAAAALTRELSASHPRAARIAGPLLYGGATMVGLSRTYDDRHWASDVVVGAAIGTLIGRKLVEHQHANPGNRLDRWLIPSSTGLTTHGVALGWEVQFR